jgi:hypothetical protein
MFDGGGRHGVAVHPALDVRSESSRCTVKNDPEQKFTGAVVIALAFATIATSLGSSRRRHGGDASTHLGFPHGASGTRLGETDDASS